MISSARCVRDLWSEIGRERGLTPSRFVGSAGCQDRVHRLRKGLLDHRLDEQRPPRGLRTSRLLRCRSQRAVRNPLPQSQRLGESPARRRRNGRRLTFRIFSRLPEKAGDRDYIESSEGEDRPTQERQASRQELLGGLDVRRHRVRDPKGLAVTRIDGPVRVSRSSSYLSSPRLLTELRVLRFARSSSRRTAFLADLRADTTDDPLPERASMVQRAAPSSAIPRQTLPVEDLKPEMFFNLVCQVSLRSF